MSDTTRPLSVRKVRPWGGNTMLGLGEVRLPLAQPDHQSKAQEHSASLCAAEPRVITRRIAPITSSMALERQYALDLWWASFPIWGATVLLASSFAFALGALVALLFTH